MANVNNYINAARAVAQDSAQIFGTIRDSSPGYDEIAKANISETAKTKATYAINEAAAARARINAETDINLAKRKAKTEKDIRGIKKQARMTGRLAGGAALLGIGAMQLNKKEEVDPTLGVLSEQMKRYDTRISNIQADIKRLDELGDSLNSNNTTNKNSGTSTSSSSDTSTSSSKNTATKPSSKSSSAWSRLSDIIRFGEGTLGDKGYNTQFTGTTFTDTSRHPRQIKTSGSLSSDAAGAYQFLSTTWDGAKKALGLTDFSPASQEAAGRYLTQQRGVDPDKNIETFEEFRSVMDKLAPEWASLPYSGKSPGGYGQGSSYYGQGGKSLEELWSRYQNSGL